jgi:hypothetical protein
MAASKRSNRMEDALDILILASHLGGNTTRLPEARPSILSLSIAFFVIALVVAMLELVSCHSGLRLAEQGGASEPLSDLP